MSCTCIPQIVEDNTRKSCKDCLIVRNLYYSCTEAPAPCGGVINLNLADYNDLSACDECTPVYILDGYDPAFSSVTLSSNGVMDITLGNNFNPNETYTIYYSVDCPCSILSASATVKVCFKDICLGVDCPSNQECDKCTGTCVDKQSDLDIDNGSVGTHGSGGTGFF